MALAPLVPTIWNRVMTFDRQVLIWLNRDRFILSNGYASMLLWSILHLIKTQAVNAEYENLGHPSVSLDDIRRLRRRSIVDPMLLKAQQSEKVRDHGNNAQKHPSRPSWATSRPEKPDRNGIMAAATISQTAAA
jgi:transketolase-like protein